MAIHVDEFVTVVKSKVDGSVRAATAAMKDASEVAGKMASAFAAGAVALGGLVLSAADAGTEILRGSRKLDVSIEQYQRLAVVARQAGTDVESLADMALDFSERMDDAAQGGATYGDLFARIGISPDKLRDESGALRSFTDVLPDVLDGLSGIASTSERASIGSQLFGGNFLQLKNIMAQGGDVFRDAIAGADDITFLFDQETAEASERLTVALADVASIGKSIVLEVVAPLIKPTLGVVEAFKDWAIASRKLIGTKIAPIIEDLADGFERLSGPVKTVVEALAGAVTAFGLARTAGSFAAMAESIPVIGTTIAGMAGALGPMVALTGAVVALGVALADVAIFASGGQSAIEGMIRATFGDDAVEPIRGMVNDLADMMMDATAVVSMFIGRAFVEVANGAKSAIARVLDLIPGVDGQAAVDSMANITANAARGWRLQREAMEAGATFRELSSITPASNFVGGRVVSNAITEELAGTGALLFPSAFTAAGIKGVDLATDTPGINDPFIQNVNINFSGIAASDQARIAQDAVRKASADIAAALGIPVGR